MTDEIRQPEIKATQFGDYRDFIPEAQLLNDPALPEEADADKLTAPESEGTVDVQKASSENTEVDETSPDDDKDTSEDEEELSRDEGKRNLEELQGRLDELTTQVRGAEDKVKTLEDELAQAREKLDKTHPIQIAPTPENPFAHADTLDQLAQRMDEARQAWRWASENPDGAVYKTAEGQEIDVSAEQMRKIGLDAQEAMQVHAPRRAAYIQQRDQYDDLAKKDYPELFQSGSAQSAKLRELILAWPEVTRFPDYKRVLGDYLAGQAAREAKAKKTVEEQKKPQIALRQKLPVAPPVPRSRGITQSSSAHSQASGLKKAAQKVFSSGGNVDSLADFLMAKASVE